MNHSTQWKADIMTTQGNLATHFDGFFGTQTWKKWKNKDFKKYDLRIDEDETILFFPCLLAHPIQFNISSLQIGQWTAIKSLIHIYFQTPSLSHPSFSSMISNWHICEPEGYKVGKKEKNGKKN